ncbi:diguanylate cyclase (GGDEF)-like protein [Paucimonas lemoignei]|uniref:diguanylate cyclase n=2 Tax=Paucimonas lemoignei TaxID=29443 RepID=A0A4R3HTM6_PAULE|nr:diguanylate cyclase (GGDEF)-like protein [Paucimonas lemoignei]
MIFLLALLPALGLAIFNSHVQYENQKAHSRESALRVVRLLKGAHTQIIDDAKSLVKSMAQFPPFRDQAAQRCNFLRKSFPQMFQRFSDIALAAPDGNILCSTGNIDRVAMLGSTPFFSELLTRRDVGTGAYRFDPMLASPYVLIGAPVLSRENDVDAILLATLDFSAFEALQLTAQLSSDSVIFVFDSSGLFLARYPDPEGWEGTNRITKAAIFHAVQSSLADEGTLDLLGADGVPRLFAYTKLRKAPGQTVYLATGVPVALAYANARQDIVADLITYGGLLLLVLLIAWAAVQALVSRKLRRLVQSAGRLQAGELGARTGMQGAGDEIGKLAAAFDAMADSMESRILELQRHGNEMRDLKEMSDAMQVCATQDEVLAIVRQFALRLFPDQPGALYLTHASGDFFELRTHWHEPVVNSEFLPQDCWAARRGKVYRVDAASNQPRCHHVHTPPPINYMCVPLMAQGEMLGILHLENDQAARLADEQPVAMAFAEHTALTLANLRLRDKLHVQAMRDGLTGLLNRRFMEESLLRETRHARRNHSQIAIIMIDIDHFKRFNDTFGHAAGDALLRAIGKMLQEAMRGSDLACRYGGEEFTVILPGTPLQAAATIAEKLRESTQSMEVAMEGQALGKITISLGVACFPEHGDTYEAVLHAADLALMHAKQTRNRVVKYAQDELEIRRQTQRR